jgi:hypothetical protein
MNIFALDNDPVKAAQMHCDKHVVKMIVEAAQMLSTAHRMIDGKMEIIQAQTPKGLWRKKKVWTHPNKKLDQTLYKVAHPGHPSTKWTMESSANYEWHYQLFVALCDEYTYRYGKVHKTDTLLRKVLAPTPKKIVQWSLTPFALAMKSAPQCMDPKNPVASYRAFYQTKQDRFKMVWTGRKVPRWFNVSSMIQKAA